MSGRINLDNISDDFKSYLQGLGLTEEQVNEAISLFVGDKELLETNDKSSIVNAINEVFQSANNGKELIANAIGSPLSSEDTFNAMSDKINKLSNRFKSILENKGVEVLEDDKIDELIEKVIDIVNFDLPKWAIINDKWVKLPDMPVGRNYLTSGGVDTKIYCIGGEDADTNYTNANDCFDLSTAEWETKTNMITSRRSLSSGVVGSKIYCIGGTNGTAIANNECYDTITDKWETKTSMTTARYSFASGVVDNRIYCIGGTNGTATTSNECYDPSTDTWSSKTDITNTSCYNMASSALDDKIYCMGGATGTTRALKYDTTTNTWSSIAYLPMKRYSATAATVNGNVYCIGGYYTSGTGTPYATTYCYNPSTNTWTTKTDMSNIRSNLTSCVLLEKIFCLGGYGYSISYLKAFECYVY